MTAKGVVSRGRNGSRQEKTVLAARREPFFLGENSFFLVTDNGAVTRGEPLGQELDVSWQGLSSGW